MKTIKDIELKENEELIYYRRFGNKHGIIYVEYLYMEEEKQPIFYVNISIGSWKEHNYSFNPNFFESILPKLQKYKTMYRWALKVMEELDTGYRRGPSYILLHRGSFKNYVPDKWGGLEVEIYNYNTVSFPGKIKKNIIEYNFSQKEKILEVVKRQLDPKKELGLFKNNSIFLSLPDYLKSSLVELLRKMINKKKISNQ